MGAGCYITKVPISSNLNKIQISAMGAGCLGADSKDVLFVGSQTHFLAYDVHNNSDLFYRFVHQSFRGLPLGVYLQGQG